ASRKRTQSRGQLHGSRTIRHLSGNRSAWRCARRIFQRPLKSNRPEGKIMTNLLNSMIVGTEITPVQTNITARGLMSYAASLGALEDVYLNDLREDGIVGLPSYVISPEWKIMNG